MVSFVRAVREIRWPAWGRSRLEPALRRLLSDLDLGQYTRLLETGGFTWLEDLMELSPDDLIAHVGIANTAHARRIYRHVQAERRRRELAAAASLLWRGLMLASVVAAVVSLWRSQALRERVMSLCAIACIQLWYRWRLLAKAWDELPAPSPRGNASESPAQVPPASSATVPPARALAWESYVTPEASPGRGADPPVVDSAMSAMGAAAAAAGGSASPPSARRLQVDGGDAKERMRASLLHGIAGGEKAIRAGLKKLARVIELSKGPPASQHSM